MLRTSLHARAQLKLPHNIIEFRDDDKIFTNTYIINRFLVSP